MIETFDNVLTSDEYQTISEMLYGKPNWTWGAKTDGTIEDSARLWQVNFKDFDGVVNPEILKIWENLKKRLNISDKYEIQLVYANGQTHMMDGDWHTDSTDNGRTTFLYYFTKGDENIIGDTEFNIGGEITSIKPETNTAILFPSNILHRGCGPKKEFKDLRVTIAFKLLKKNNTLL
jgi:hypothetical protein